MNNTNPIQVLINEHDVIVTAEEIINLINNTWQQNEEKYIENVKKLILFFREYSDEFHHKKEEDILFKELMNNPDFLLKDIISELENHHEMFRETVVEIEEAINNKEFEKAQKKLNSFINDLLDHIAVENDELFSMAESLYDEDELKRIFFLFEDKERELGVERKAALADSLKTIAK
jgi:hemerythrin-like domain-containing protein